jgi:hypothetical protein
MAAADDTRPAEIHPLVAFEQQKENRVRASRGVCILATVRGTRSLEEHLAKHGYRAYEILIDDRDSGGAGQAPRYLEIGTTVHSRTRGRPNRRIGSRKLDWRPQCRLAPLPCN